jgi:aspartokinase-like uncharacterized kinase
MSRAIVRVVKVGGSLFDWPDLPTALTAWLTQQTPGKNYLLAGGGPWVEALRQAAKTHSLSDAFCHEAAIGLMSTSAAVLRELLAEHAPEAEVLDARGWLANTPIALPNSWDVTSDSIAAAIAQSLSATELVLLKSVGLARDQSLEEAAKSGCVDPYFPIAAARLSVRIINLRDLS